MRKDYIILRSYSKSRSVLNDPLFSEVLCRVAEWVNTQGLKNKKCTNFLINVPDGKDPLNVMTTITCDIEEIMEK